MFPRQELTPLLSKGKKIRKTLAWKQQTCIYTNMYLQAIILLLNQDKAKGQGSPTEALEVVTWAVAKLRAQLAAQ